MLACFSKHANLVVHDIIFGPHRDFFLGYSAYPFRVRNLHQVIRMSSDDEDQAAVDMLEPGERLNHVAHRTIQRKQQAMLAERRCPICWISHERCICPFFSKQQIPHRFLVLLHHHGMLEP